MHHIAIITTAFGNGLEDREKTYAALADELGLHIRYCTKDELLADPKESRESSLVWKKPMRSCFPVRTCG